VLMNLALNASEAMPDGGKLTLETRNAVLDADYCLTHHGVKPGNYAMLRVSDTGRGMDKETIDRMFDPFFTTKGWDSRKGTGLGLATVRGIVQQHEGHIECISQRGKGTMFHIYLPVPAGTGARDAVPSEHAQTILLVEDEEHIRDLGRRYLSRAGYNVVEAGNGREALDLYKKNQNNISLIILDLIMPEMGGKQCLEELFKLNPNLKVLIASGYSADELLEKAVQKMARGFVGKPFDRKELLRAVRNVLDEDEDDEFAAGTGEFTVAP